MGLEQDDTQSSAKSLEQHQAQKRLTSQALQSVLRGAECLYKKTDVMRAYDALAQKINATYVGLNPTILVVMKGGMIPAGQLMMRLSVFHRMSYIHATRYGNKTEGSALNWLVKPSLNIEGEHILVIDDIFDEGVTLSSIVQELAKGRPKSIKTCVLVNKLHDRKTPGFNADFVGLNVPDRFIFGCGMDYHGYLRHLDGIYALQ